MISNLVNEGVMMPLMQTLSTSPKNSLESRSKLFSICTAKQLQNQGRRKANISHKNQEISILYNSEKSKARLTLLQQAMERHGKTKQRTKDQVTKTKKDQNSKEKHKSGMDNSASLTPVQAPLTVACMIVTSL
jgi:hypothetical protein